MLGTLCVTMVRFDLGDDYDMMVMVLAVFAAAAAVVVVVLLTMLKTILDVCGEVMTFAKHACFFRIRTTKSALVAFAPALLSILLPCLVA